MGESVPRDYCEAFELWNLASQFGASLGEFYEEIAYARGICREGRALGENVLEENI